MFTTNNSRIDQLILLKNANPDERDAKESRIQGKSESIKDKTSGKISEFIEGTKNEDIEKGSANDIKPIIFWLFAWSFFIVII